MCLVEGRLWIVHPITNWARIQGLREANSNVCWLPNASWSLGDAWVHESVQKLKGIYIITCCENWKMQNTNKGPGSKNTWMMMNLQIQLFIVLWLLFSLPFWCSYISLNSSKELEIEDIFNIFNQIFPGVQLTLST